VSEVSSEEFAYTLGLLAGEGSFYITFTRDDRYKHGVYFGPKVCISMGEYSQEMLQNQQGQHELGYVNESPKGYAWTLSARDECHDLARRIDDYLEEHPDSAFLQSAKYDAYQSWREAIKFLTPGKSLSADEVVQLAELRDEINYIRATSHITTEEIKRIMAED
jgi:hypothetical protein